MNFAHPLARVLGKGTAKSGVDHWWHQRLTAIALVPLTMWVVYALIALSGADHPTVAAWLSDPLRGSLMIAWMVAMLYHGQLGLQVIIEDYVHVHWLEITLHITIKLVIALAIIVAVLSVLRVVLGGGA